MLSRFCFAGALILGAGVTPGLTTSVDGHRIPTDSAGAGRDSTRDSTSAGARIYEYIAYPTLQLITWPVEKLLVPVVRVLTYPTQEPIRYVLKENVIDRTLNIVTYGDQQQIQVYPTLNLAPGTSSRTGLTLRDKALFGRNTEKLVSYVLYYVNGDYKARAYVTADQLLGSNLFAKVGASVTRMKNASVNEPGTDYFLFYSDSSEQYQFLATHPAFLNFQVRGGMTLRHNSFGAAAGNLLTKDTIAGDFFPYPGDSISANRAYRGLDQTFWDRVWEVGLTRDTRNNENITLAGSWTDLTLQYHDAGLNHSFYDWVGQYTTYFKLGRERYEITAEEERRNGNISVQKILRQLEYEKIRNGIFSRKVLVVHFYAAQSYEISGNSMPVYGLQTLGNDTPLRGYAGSRFRDYTVAAVSTEYRFPIIRLMDGTLFDEYGVSGKSWDSVLDQGLRNTWGFGIRVRRPDIFLFRAELGIHGLSGTVFNLSVDAPF